MKALRFFKRKPRSHRKTNRPALTVASHQRRAPVDGHAPTKLPSLPSGAMQQRTVELPARTAHSLMPANADLAEAAARLTGSFSGHFRLDGNVPLFRDDETTWKQFEDSRLERLRRLQDLTNAKTWPDAHGVNLGTDHGPKTLVFSTSDYARFSDGTGSIPAVKR